MTERKAGPPGREADDDIEPPRVGRVIRRLRQEQKLSLAELALQSGVAVGSLSEIERDIANPSLRTLTRIRMVLGVPLSALFEDAPMIGGDPDFIRRATRRPRLDLGPRYVVKELLSSSVAQNMQFMILNIMPGGGSGEDTLQYPAEKGGMVLEGKLALVVDDVKVTVETGDSFQFDSQLPHSFRNETQELARVLWIIGQTKPSRHL